MTRVDTPSTPNNVETNNNVSTAGNNNLPAGASAKSINERLNELQNRATPTNIMINVKPNVELPQGPQPIPSIIPSCSPYVSQNGVILQKSQDDILKKHPEIGSSCMFR